MEKRIENVLKLEQGPDTYSQNISNLKAQNVCLEIPNKSI